MDIYELVFLASELFGILVGIAFGLWMYLESKRCQKNPVPLRIVFWCAVFGALLAIPLGGIILAALQLGGVIPANF